MLRAQQDPTRNEKFNSYQKELLAKASIANSVRRLNSSQPPCCTSTPSSTNYPDWLKGSSSLIDKGSLHPHSTDNKISFKDFVLIFEIFIQLLPQIRGTD